jgi:hypothetical protein
MHTLCRQIASLTVQCRQVYCLVEMAPSAPSWHFMHTKKNLAHAHLASSLKLHVQVQVGPYIYLDSSPAVFLGNGSEESRLGMPSKQSTSRGTSFATPCDDALSAYSIAGGCGVHGKSSYPTDCGRRGPGPWSSSYSLRLCPLHSYLSPFKSRPVSESQCRQPANCTSQTL